MAFRPPANAQHLELPKAYTDLKYKEIRVTHVPETSKEVTPVVLLTLYRPKNYNAFTRIMMEELEHAYTLFDVDDRVKVIVQTGHGRMFCAGADLDVGFAGGQENPHNHRDGGGRVALAIMRCRKPSIGALNGSAVGIGITMTLPMNIRIAYEKAKIGFVFAQRGIITEGASHFFLPRLIGASKALHLVTTAQTYPANHPLLSSLFSETLPTPEAVLPRALEIAQQIASTTSLVSTALMKELIYRGADSPEAAHLLDSRVIYELFGGKDNSEGVKAFLEKRPARFSGTMQHDAPAAYPWWQPVDTSRRPVQEGYEFKPKL